MRVNEWFKTRYCLAYPITYARDTNDSGSLKNDSCFFKKKILSAHQVLSQWLFHICWILNFNKHWNMRKRCLGNWMTIIEQTIFVSLKNLKFIYHTLVFDELHSSFSKFYLNLSLDFLRLASSFSQNNHNIINLNVVPSVVLEV